MSHEHVKIKVIDAESPGSESVPALRLDDGSWELLSSPLYATEIASGDVIKVLDKNSGSYEIIKRGGNVCIHFYLGEPHINSESETAKAKSSVALKLSQLDGRIDASVSGLLSCTIPVNAGFNAIELVFNELTKSFLGSQWQFTNVYNSTTGEPLMWWEPET